MESPSLTEVLHLERMFTKPVYACQALIGKKAASLRPAVLKSISLCDEHLSEQICSDISRSLSDRQRYPSLNEVVISGAPPSAKNRSASYQDGASNLEANGVSYQHNVYSLDEIKHF